jgi:DNA-binding winged helix-turn-helix (wHTH) protein
MSSGSKRLADFGPFTFNLSERTLQKSNVPVDLHRRAAEILGYLIEHRGQWVSKEELKNQIWRKQFVEASAINHQIFEIRRALADSPTKPHFIETKYQYGWRFIASVSERTEIEPEQPLPEVLKQARDARLGRGSASAFEATAAQSVIAAPRRISARATALLAIAFVLIVAALALWLLPKSQPRIVNSVQLTDDGKHKTGPLLTDGHRIFFMEEIAGNNKVFSIPVSGGEPVLLNIPLTNATLQDISRDGTTLLLQSYEPNESELWAYSIGRRSLQRVQSQSSCGAWTLDGRLLASASTDQSSIEISGQRDFRTTF